MPHKHRRRHDAVDESLYDLPPSARARPLPPVASKNAALSESFLNKKTQRKHAKKERKQSAPGYGADDTPKAFARLMAMQKTAGSGKRIGGLDNGADPSRKRKRTEGKAKDPEKAGAAGPQQKKTKKGGKEGDGKADADATAPALPTIQPGEKLRDFAARVDAALPVAGLARSRGQGGVRESRVTRHEKRLKKLQAGWREEEARIREKEREAAEEEEEAREEEREWLAANRLEELADGVVPPVLGGGGKKKKKGKKGKKVFGEVADGDDDPWKALERKRRAEELEKKQQQGVPGVSDVVQAPPTFTVTPREKFKPAKVLAGARVRVEEVPRAAGSVARREALGDARRDVIESYRRLLGERRV